MNKNYIKVLQHPDKDEIISKLIIGMSASDIRDWLASKYVNPGESKFILSEKYLKSFQDDYLDLYNVIREDLAKTKASAGSDSLALSVQNSPAYKKKMLELAGKELDIRQIITNLCVAIESRLAQVFDEIQEDPKNINTRIDRLLIEYAETLGNILEKYYKFTEAPQTNTIQHNVTLQVVDQHITVFHDVIREVLSQMDLETSLYFMEVFNEKMSKLKPPAEKEYLNTDVRLAEAKLLNETINKKINE